MAPIALAFAVLEIGSASDLGIVLAAAWLPQIAFILVGGVWADRVSRSLLMVGANVLSGITQGVIAVLFLTGHAELWNLVVLQIARGIATSFFFPASQGIVPQIVDATQIQPANALLRLSQTATNIVGAALGGVLVAAIGSGWAIAFRLRDVLRQRGDPLPNAPPRPCRRHKRGVSCASSRKAGTSSPRGRGCGSSSRAPA